MNNQTHINTKVKFNPFLEPEIEHVIKTTKAQSEILVDCILGGDDAKRAYNIPCNLKIFGQLNLNAFKDAIKALIKRHEALRSCFSEDGRYMCVFKDIDFNITYQDLSNLNKETTNANLKEIIDNNANHIFDLTNGPLFTVGLYKIDVDTHFLILNFNHAVCDGLSVDSFLNELGTLYTCNVNNEATNLPTPKQFSTFAIRENLFAKTQEFQDSESFWLNMYKDSIPKVELPLDYNRPKARTYDNAIVHHKLNNEIFNQLKQIGLNQGSSIVTTFLSAFEVFLSKITGQNDLVIGLSTSRQAHYNMIGMIGHTVNLLPLRSAINPKINFSDYLKQRKTELFDAYEHQSISFGHILQKLPIKRDISRIPLVPVMMNIELNNNLESTFSFGDLKHKVLKNHRNYASFEIEVQAHMSDDGPYLLVNYNTTLFKKETIENMMVSFEYFVKQLTEQPDLAISEIIINNHISEYNKLNDTKRDYPEQPLHELVALQTKKSPNKTAFKFCNETLSYEQLQEKTNQIAQYLIKQNVNPGDFVAVSLPRSIELVPVLLAIMQCGAAYVPLDPSFPKSRLDFMLEDCNAKYLITTKDLAHSFSQNQPKLLVEDLKNVIEDYPTTFLNVNVSSSATAYILYTSGSTGKPKGVTVTHGNLVNFLTSMAQEPGINANDTLLSITTISFDIAGLELFLPLITGATLELANDETAKDGRLLLEYLQENDISILQATPTTWQMLIDVGWKNHIPLKALCGGEAMPLSLSNKLLTLCDELWNMYGPTETTIWSSTKQILPTDDIITIGKPIANTQFYIVNDNLKLAEQGEIGELTIAGDGVALGYLNRPDLTSEKFISNPFSDGSNTVLYRTGDLGKLLPNGELQCLGRADQQVKIRGYRIELGEIEQALTLNNSIQSAAVLAQNNKLVAYVVPERELLQQNLDINDIKNTLGENLPDYFIPQEFKILEKLPTTLNGKIDRKALNKPEPEEISEPDYTGPRTQAEKIVAEIWQNCLEIDEIDIFSDFFELGGQSIIAVRVMTLLEEQTGKRLPLASLFSHPTIEKLALLLDMDNRFITWDSLVPIKKGGTKTPLYIVHGAGMNVLIFNALAKNLDDDQPVYALQAKGLNGIDEPHGTVEEMAAHYIKAILKSNPKGPYALAGYSFGGIIAYEMARQMQKLDKKITMLAMLDTYIRPHYYYKSALRKKLAKTNQRLKSNLYVFYQMAMSWEHTKRRIDTKKRNIKNFYLGLKYGKEKHHEEVYKQPYQLDKMNSLAIRKYQIKPEHLKVDLFRVQDSSFYMHDRKYLGWRKVALKGVEVHNIPGDHVQLFSPPNDKKSALILQNILDERDSEQLS